MSSQLSVYIGTWLNHARHPVLGATITLTTKNAGFLENFLTILITTAGGSCWRVVSYLAHQTQSDAGLQPALKRQQQIVLKNSETASSAASNFLRISYAWRKHARTKSWYTSILLVIIASVIALGFRIAGLFTSQVTKAAGTNILVNGANCGFWQYESNNEGNYGYLLKVLNDTLGAASYARQCYDKDSLSLQCSTFPVPQLSWSENVNASCPFESQTCLLGATAAYQMDTGDVDSHSILGINSRPSERITLRKVTTCSPVRVRPYAEVVYQDIGKGKDKNSEAFVRLNMGPTLSSNYTYQMNTHAALGIFEYNLQYVKDLEIERRLRVNFTRTLQAPEGQPSFWQPLPAFKRADADVSMFFLSPNSLIYGYRNSDPMFSANINYTISMPDGRTQTLYEGDQNVYVTGCADQFQFCNPSKSTSEGCTPLGSYFALIDGMASIGLNTYQFQTANTIFYALRGSSMYDSVSGPGASALKAKSTVFGLSQVAPLPNNQWQIELSGWFAASLAIVQQSLLEIATGPAHILESGGEIRRPAANSTSARAICQRQIIRNVSGYQNFSVLGVVIILVVGLGLIFLDFLLHLVVPHTQKLLKNDHPRLSWLEDGYLQLLRSAYVGAGYNRWKDTDMTVPVIIDLDMESQLVGGLDVSDPSQPQIIKRCILSEYP